jgi:hypothetical protein
MSAVGGDFKAKDTALWGEHGREMRRKFGVGG